MGKVRGISWGVGWRSARLAVVSSRTIGRLALLGIFAVVLVMFASSATAVTNCTAAAGPSCQFELDGDAFVGPPAHDSIPDDWSRIFDP